MRGYVREIKKYGSSLLFVIVIVFVFVLTDGKNPPNSIYVAKLRKGSGNTNSGMLRLDEKQLAAWIQGPVLLDQKKSRRLLVLPLALKNRLNNSTKV